MGGRYKAYPEYKDSGVEWVGAVPEDWQIVPLFGVAFTELEKNSFNYETNVLSLSYGRIIQRNIEDNFGLLPESFSTYQIVNPDDVILRLTDLQNDKRSLRVGLSLERGIITAAYLKLVAKPKKMSGAFLYRLLHSYDTTKVFYGMGGGLRQSMKYEDMRRLPLLIPSLIEQGKIANFLDHETAKIDTLIEKQQQLIQLLKEKRQAVISHTVTKGLNLNAKMRDSGVEWLGEVPEHWIHSSLKFYAQVIDCKHVTAEFLDDGVPLASIGEVKEKYINLQSAKMTSEKFYLELIGGGRDPRIGDIIYSRNATVGEAALVGENTPRFAMGQDVCLIRFGNNIDPEFMLQVLKSNLISQQLELAMVGSTFKRINVDSIRGFLIALPPLEEQQEISVEICDRLTKQDRVIEYAESAIKLMQERRTALISAAVTGKIDVRDWMPPTPDHHNEEAA